MKDILLTGDPVAIDWFHIYPWTIREIVKNQERYYQSLFIFFLQKKDLQFPEEFADLVETYNTFELIRVRAGGGGSFRNRLLEALKDFTREDFEFIKGEFVVRKPKQNESNHSHDDDDDSSPTEDVFVLTSEQWDRIGGILALENDIDMSKFEDDGGDNYANEAARKFKERANRTRELVEKYKKPSDITLGFLVNRLCTRSTSLNILTIWDCTFYQFKQQLDATVFSEQYDLNVNAMLQGALDTKKIKLVHWTENK